MVRLQEKASRFSKSYDRYQVCLRKSRGLLGRLAYAEDDFDLLVACIMNEGDELEGVFLVPMSKIVAGRLGGQTAPHAHFACTMVSAQAEQHQGEARLAAGLLPRPPRLAELRGAA